MRKLILGLAVSIMAFGAAQAAGGPFANARPQHMGGQGKPVLPVFQAAPWYLYWPYDAHFQTAAPLMGTGAYYGPPGYGYGGGMPYFPAGPMNQYPGTPMPVGPHR